MRESFDESGAAGRLKVSVAAWRWAVASGLVPAADAGAGRWSRAVVLAVDAEAVRAALRGSAAAFWAAERLNEALGEPLPFGRPRVTAAAVGHLVRAGHLAYLTVPGAGTWPAAHPRSHPGEGVGDYSLKDGGPMVAPDPPHLTPERCEHLEQLADAARLRMALYPSPKPPPVRRRSRSRQYPGGRANPWRTARGRRRG